MLTNPAVRFFELMPEDLEFIDDEEVIGWLQDVANIMDVGAAEIRRI